MDGLADHRVDHPVGEPLREGELGRGEFQSLVRVPQFDERELPSPGGRISPPTARLLVTQYRRAWPQIPERCVAYLGGCSEDGAFCPVCFGDTR